LECFLFLTIGYYSGNNVTSYEVLECISLPSEEEKQEAFIRVVGGVKRADRLQQIWNNSYPHGTELCGYASREQDFRNKAKEEGFSDRQIDLFLQL
jgi:hypothetical protein